VANGIGDKRSDEHGTRVGDLDSNRAERLFTTGPPQWTCRCGTRQWWTRTSPESAPIPVRVRAPAPSSTPTRSPTASTRSFPILSQTSPRPPRSRRRSRGFPPSNLSALQLDEKGI
jgi:hypothetical protein